MRIKILLNFKLDIKKLEVFKTWLEEFEEFVA